MKQILSFVFILISLHCFSQHPAATRIDSLLYQLKKTKTDTALVNLYVKISDTYIDIDLDKALLYADSAAALSYTIQWEEGIAKSQVNHGNVYNFTGNYKKALESVTKAYTFYKKNKDKKNTGTAAYTIGVAEERMGNYAIAAEKYFEALHIFETLPGENRLTGNSLSAIAVIYFLQRDYDKSLDYSFKALAKQQLAGNTMGIANEYIAIADTYNEKKDSVNAVKYNLQALEIQKKMGNRFGEALIYFQLGKLYHSNYKLSLDYHLKAETIFTALSDESNFSTFNLGEIGRLYFELARQNVPVIPFNTETKASLLAKAANYFQKVIAISRITGDKDNESSFSRDLAELQAYSGDYKNAYLNYKAFHNVQDSIYSQQNKNKIAALESQKEIDLKNKTIENKELQLSNQRTRMWLLISGIAFLIMTVAVFYYLASKRKKTNEVLRSLNKELDEANKTKAKFFGILSHDLRSPVASFINFLQLKQREPGLLSEQEIAGAEKNMRESAGALLETMETMLLWSKGQMDNFSPYTSTFAIHELFIYIERTFASTHAIRFVFKNAENLSVSTDKDYLRTIMHNLTSNAAAALHANPNAQIEWNAWTEEGIAFISIADNGPGVDTDKLSALYDSTARIGTRHGLGLHIIRDLAKAIGCTILVKKGLKNETIFILKLK